MRMPFRSLRAQLVLLIVGALALAQAISLWLFVDERSLALRAALGFEAAGRAANVVRLLEEAPPELHSAILRAADSPLVRFSVDRAPTVTHAGHGGGGLIVDRIRRMLGERSDRDIRAEVHEIEGRIMPMPNLSPQMQEIHRAMMSRDLRAVEMNLSIALRDGGWLNVGTRFARPPLQWPMLSILTFGTTAAVILIAAFWYLATRLTGPLSRLVRSAEMFGRGEDVAPLPEVGPEEVRSLTRAFNRMQMRLSRFVADRTRILAAVSHDLRSPLTALRVRAEMVEDDETREALIESIEEMQQMAGATLDFATGLSGAEAPEAVMLPGMLEELAAEAPERVELAPGPEVELRLRPIAMRRALRNLLANAMRYGGRAHVSWKVEGGDLLIEIRDQGPGIPEADLERVFDPFYRLEASRSRDTGGHGLGLSIARTIVRAHGGDVVLVNHPRGGLLARVTLPLQGMDETEQSDRMTGRETRHEPMEKPGVAGGGNDGTRLAGNRAG